eukprot:CAMPEP_0198244412 /NCGR_PEP_ID=MMETSP1446-20131203/34825_1 /TAXON_ID=1461542 ORGANISM="Unidentified sp, Strain CCMP2111" /NCGR_SAMPLE_ID=MMETSP1446 /ASSEMBLY_ACC=CAM_ASM_001112 /LENGTH=209 /DNA_ID=CAMNT_0043928437 /DNA_START=407 /DNA_END=1033 /DNA_ORIENTATION=-
MPSAARSLGTGCDGASFDSREVVFVFVVGKASSLAAKGAGAVADGFRDLVELGLRQFLQQPGDGVVDLEEDPAGLHEVVEGPTVASGNGVDEIVREPRRLGVGEGFDRTAVAQHRHGLRPRAARQVEHDGVQVRPRQRPSALAPAQAIHEGGVPELVTRRIFVLAAADEDLRDAREDFLAGDEEGPRARGVCAAIVLQRLQRQPVELQR